MHFETYVSNCFTGLQKDEELPGYYIHMTHVILTFTACLNH